MSEVTNRDEDEPRLIHLVGTSKFDSLARVSDPDWIPRTDKPFVVRETTTVREIEFPDGY